MAERHVLAGVMVSEGNNPAWDPEKLSGNPHDQTDKARRVEAMFNAIAPSYDLNNRVHSLWRDQAWRRVAVAMCGLQPGERVLDVACGTGDLSFAFAKCLKKIQAEHDLEKEQVVGVDFTEGMLDVARIKAQRQHLDIPFYQGDAMALEQQDEEFDVVSIAFGIRNVAQPEKAFAEFYRVLKPGGRLMVLEFSTPRFAPLRWAYNFYFHHVLPRTAAWIARDRSGAYKYLPRSVETFFTREQMRTTMQQAGFRFEKASSLTCGIAVAYLARKA